MTLPALLVTMPASGLSQRAKPLVNGGADAEPVSVISTGAEVLWTPQLSVATAVRVTTPGVSRFT